MKVLIFLGLCLALHAADVGSKKIPPFRPEHDEKTDEVFGIRDKRGVFDKIPPVVSDEGDKLNGMVAGHHSNLNKREQEDGINLPLLMKTLRLRPGSGDDIKRIIDDYINSHKEGGNVGGDENVDEPRLLGEPLIGKNRHPKGGDHNVHKREADDENAEDLKLPGKNLIPKHRHPKGGKKDGDDDGHGIHKRDVEGGENKGNDGLPLLLKTHRLRPGSGDEIQRIIDDYIKAHKSEQQGEGGDGDQLPELPGKHLIGGNRHPKGDGDDGKKHHEGDDGQLPPPQGGIDLPLLMKTHRLRPGSGDDIQRIIDDYIKAHNDGNVGDNDGHDIHKRDVEGDKSGIDLPLLMKTHRLRPGSGDDIQRIIDDYIKAHKTGDGVKVDENAGEEVKLPGQHLIPKERHPRPDDDFDRKHHGAADGQQPPPPPPPQNGIDLPLLLKTHRLRPGSGDDIQRIIDDYINAHKGGEAGDDGVRVDVPADGEIKLPGRHLIPKERHPKPEDDKKDVDAQSSVEKDEDVNDDSDIRPLGMGMIGKFRRPPVNGKARIVKGNGNGKPPGQVECKEEDRQQVLRCFRGYFKNFDLELVDGKLPTMREIFLKFKEIKDYEKHQKCFKEFSGCFKSTPESCFHADELCKISQQGEEADYLATFFTISEFSFKSKHNKKIAKCFIKQVEKCAQHKGQDFKECDTAKEIINEAIEKFNVNCAKLDPQPDDLKTLLTPFLDRTTLGENCPNLISGINV